MKKRTAAAVRFLRIAFRQYGHCHVDSLLAIITGMPHTIIESPVPTQDTHCMRVGMHEMHALRVRGFVHGNDRGDLMLVLLLWIGQLSERVGGVMTQPHRGCS